MTKNPSVPVGKNAFLQRNRSIARLKPKKMATESASGGEGTAHEEDSWGSAHRHRKRSCLLRIETKAVVCTSRCVGLSRNEALASNRLSIGGCVCGPRRAYNNRRRTYDRLL